VDLTYVKQTGESNGDAGDPYTGLNRFGHVVDQRWVKTSDGSHTDRFQYGYDRDGNRSYRDNLVNTAFGEVYAYDGLNQLTSFQRGTLNGSKTGITGTPSRTQSWDYDAVGNWDSFTTDGNAQSRTANRQNEVSSVSGLTTPAYDANGNQTKDETGRQYAYDAWNRPVRVKDAGGTTLVTYAYDGLNRRVVAVAGGVTIDLYYSDRWQVLEERVGGQAKDQYVWSPEYVDALVLRDRDADGNAGNGLEERLWVHQDANWNVMAILNGCGAVQERFTYDPYGMAQVRDAAWSIKSGSGFDWIYLHQGGRLNAAIGIYNYRNREYSFSLGRWVVIDPLRYHSGTNNFYEYLQNNPIRLTDPLGRVDEFTAGG
jgi:RHS repeat-associated protein